METRSLGMVESLGTKIVNRRLGKPVMTIVGTHKCMGKNHGGFLVQENKHTRTLLLPFENIEQFDVIVDKEE